MSNQAMINAIKTAISPARIATYETAIGTANVDELAALHLYAWNAQVSGALLTPLHLCEVVIRNAVAAALESVYGTQWPWATVFERSLPDPRIGYSPRRDLMNARRSTQATGKVIPELKFVFWQKMFTQRYDERLWIPYLTSVLPNMDVAKTITERRTMIYQYLDQIRYLRNRIAHHEPIFNRALADDYHKIIELVRFRCEITAFWLSDNQTALETIAKKP
jgi:hypothetical protein